MALFSGMPLNLTAYHKHLKTTHKPGEEKICTGAALDHFCPSFSHTFLPLQTQKSRSVSPKKERRHAALRSGCSKLFLLGEDSHTAELGTYNSTRKRGWVGDCALHALAVRATSNPALLPWLCAGK